ncbi:MAG: elongation factor G [Acidimicrobiales bacterium]|nr:elongation factor G [Acidimicrobiales bacterium]
MKTYSSSQIRNVVLVGHGGAGKTALAEAMLLRAGAISRVGGVMDHDPEEKDKGFSMSMALAQFEWRDHKVNLLDTPGFPDFVGEVAAALRVADLAVFVISAVDGIEVQTELIWRMAAQAGLPRAVFVNKLDRERADFDGVVAQLQDRFGAGIAPLQLPIGIETNLRGVADLLSDTAYEYTDGVGRPADMPGELADREHQVHDALVEGIVVAEDSLLERYLEGDVPAPEELAHALAHGVAAASVFPVVCGSAATGVGVDRLLDLLVDEAPSPLDRGTFTVTAGGAEVEATPDEQGEPLAFVFKSIADRHVGQLSLLKVLSGRISPDDHLVNVRTGADVRLHTLLSTLGGEQRPGGAASCGDIVAVAKLSDVHTSDTLAPKHKPVVVPPLAMPSATLPVALKARTQADEDKLGLALGRLLDEDPSLRLERNEETRQTILWGVGEAHLRSALDKLQRKFGVAVDTDEVRVAYRETILGQAEAEGKHKKQSGGRGQFGVAFLRVEPMPRGDGFSFVDAIVGGAIPRQFIPAVEKGIVETMSEGGALGFPVVDVQVTCFDGKFHPVDSDEMSFKIAGRTGFRDACSRANPVILEPVSRVEIVVPSDVQGDALGDLNSRRGRVQGTEAGDDGEQVITALVPTAELLRYAIDLRSLSGGRGRFTFEHDHYDPVPAQLTDKILADAKAP